MNLGHVTFLTVWYQTVFLCLASCSQVEGAAAPVHTRTPQVFVEVLLLHSPVGRLASLGTTTFGALAADDELVVLTSLHVLADDGVAARLDVPRMPMPTKAKCDPDRIRFGVTPHLAALDRARLDLVLDVEQEQPIRRSVVVERQPAVLDLGCAVDDDHRFVAVVTAEIVASDKDWQRILERRNAAASSAKPR